ncbi:flagellar hook-basal body complex protein FliE [Clostridium thermosuccinogenes]|jgi:flagellar hook-basal body complex protein FliE|uniref:Flagellar hook-basal body complex protein FliE n=1 Tax=Clostridium thermosuccinogenes TaxID=84032 RepID=A0A2K2FPD5_9CLOT|nr:flagellar hook-basal body complex protein FliE [Pseudoclostridium thermosuccinogenes]AUS96323.1 flagellar hook-basal body complex protein FliE [Pseudoclostridium thermosuccinogenes]PNT93003.1 flagellar hook-basal body complex protein FliE [Pseudoclostridium thermosuccinogenes]PNT98537.1 flagellar hook-basal body complex protein FliE [Pseudoclostridium thermosuccinogenes]PNU00639.1 flagellar hook-basal body complex protein FliE [Pseudoclostridium thermosuccinogenes]
MANGWVSSLGTLNTISPLKIDTGKAQNAQKAEGAVGFADFLNEAMGKVNDLQVNAEKLSDDFAAGKTDNIHEVVIAAAKADIALQFTLQIRNKILDAYNEIMRMQI